MSSTRILYRPVESAIVENELTHLAQPEVAADAVVDDKTSGMTESQGRISDPSEREFSSRFVEPAADGPTRPRVVVLFGGRSGEHAISCATAAGVLRAIDRMKFDVVPVGITPAGRWVPVNPDPAIWEIRDGVLPEVSDSDEEILLPTRAGSRELRILGADGRVRRFGRVDVVFPLIHGPYGEDGTLQGSLDLVDIPYVGSGVLASALSMDKPFMKAVLQARGLPVGPYTVIRPEDWDRDPNLCEDAVASLGYPVFVKPARAGSSLGVTKVNKPSELRVAIGQAQVHDPKVIVEKEIVGREIECAVLGGQGGSHPRTSLPGEIAVTGGDHDFYDFEAKYLDAENVALSCPAELPHEVVADVRNLAARTFDAVGAEGLARVDFFVTDRGRAIVNEINTMPGFTPFSMYPQLWARTGIDYQDLITELIELALARRVGLR